MRYWKATKSRKEYFVKLPQNPPESNLVQKAVNHFGVTDNPREAGYILPDGRLLDFSGRHYAVGYKDKKPIEGKPDYLANQRNVDHREVYDVVGKGGVEGMTIMENEGNMIRINPSSEIADFGVSFNVEQHPTDAQWRAISNIQRRFGGVIIYDIYKGGNHLESGEVKYVTELRSKFEAQ